jgi:RNA-binding protein YlmH
LQTARWLNIMVPIRVDKLLAAGFGLSRTAVRGMADSGRIRPPMAIDAKAREDFTLFVTTTAHRPAGRHCI